VAALIDLQALLWHIQRILQLLIQKDEKMLIQPDIKELIHGFLLLHFPTSSPPELGALSDRPMLPMAHVEAWRAAVFGDSQVDTGLLARDVLVLDFVFQKGVEYQMKINNGCAFIEKFNHGINKF
jgi:hypothetical protein